MTKLIIAGIDIETTGFEAELGHRITEIAIDVYELFVPTMELTKRGVFHRLINPQRDIPAKVQEITNITPGLVKYCPTWNEIGPKVASILAATDIFVAHNANFDAPFLAHEILRIGQKIDLDMETYCTMQNGRFATPFGKCPKLAELCWALGVEFDSDSAHRANFDTDRMMAALLAGVKGGYFDLAPAIARVVARKSATEVAA